MTSRRSRCPPSRTGSRCARNCGCGRCGPTTSWPGCWTACPSRPPTRRRPLADPRLDRRPVPVTWAPSAHARRLLTLAIGALVLAIFTRRPEFAGLAAPPLILLATWRTDRPADLSLGVDGPHGRVIERDEVAVLVSLAGQGEYDAELTLLPVAEIFAGPTVIVPADPQGRPATVRVRFRAARWGRRRP